MSARAVVFSMYLSRLMIREGFDELSLSKELGFRTLVPVWRWIESSAMPLATDLPLLAKVLNEDLITMSMGWLMAQCYELERPIRDQVLRPLSKEYLDPI